MSLNAEQIAFFKANGYLLIPGAMDQTLCAQVRDLMWDALPEASSLDREDPTSHQGPFPEEEQSTDSLHLRDGYRWLNRHLGVSQAVIDLIYSPSICAMAEQLLGAPLRQAVPGGTPMGSRGPAWPGGPTDPALGTEGARGVYCTLPYGDRAREPDACHTDGHPFQLGVVGLIDDTPADGGAFKVWPGSHRRLYQTFQLRYDQPRIPYYDHLPGFKGIVHTDAYLAEIEALNQEPAVECFGEAGDIVFWHHRTAHMAGHNHSTVIRQAVLADFWKPELDEYRAVSPNEDMWQDWSGAVQNAPDGYSAEFAAAQRLPQAL
ncbi:MAG: phytanoyl-CoA dioxygenase family protein [Pseudomonadota bacterium]